MNPALPRMLVCKWLSKKVSQTPSDGFSGNLVRNKELLSLGKHGFDPGLAAALSHHTSSTWAAAPGLPTSALRAGLGGKQSSGCPPPVPGCFALLTSKQHAQSLAVGRACRCGVGVAAAPCPPLRSLLRTLRIQHLRGPQGKQGAPRAVCIFSDPGVSGYSLALGR